MVYKTIIVYGGDTRAKCEETILRIAKELSKRHVGCKLYRTSRELHTKNVRVFVRTSEKLDIFGYRCDRVFGYPVNVAMGLVKDSRSLTYPGNAIDYIVDHEEQIIHNNMLPEVFKRWAEELINSPNQKLVGSIDKGYTYFESIPPITLNYCKGDVEATRRLYERYVEGKFMPEIKKVIFNYPATIVLWSDNTKTVVKCQDGDVFDYEKGLAMAVCKKLLGNNTGKYYDIFNKWIPAESMRDSEVEAAEAVSE